MFTFSHINWGDVPTWVGAVGAIGAFVVYYLLLKGELLQRQEEVELRRSYTPRRTAAWTDGPNSLVIQNGGDEPVFALVVYVGRMGTDFNDVEQMGSWYELVVGTMGPGTKFDETVSETYTAGEHFPDIPEVAIEFTDCNGTHWRREPGGKLHTIKTRRSYD